MFPRLLPSLAGALSCARCLSTVGGGANGPTGPSGFLSDLMKKIDNINMKTRKFAKTQAPPVKEAKKPYNASGNPKKEKKIFMPPRTVIQPARAEIQVKDHPLSSNMFKLMDEMSFKRGKNQKSVPSARLGARKSSGTQKFAGKSAAYDGKSGSRPQPARDRNTGPRKAGFDKKKPKFAVKTRLAARPASIVPKTLASVTLKPALTGEKFLYGKPSKFAVSTSTRVAAVAKEFLLKSQYPYRLPRSIIAGMDLRFLGNRFILQKDFDLSVDAQELEDRVRKVVRGETEELAVLESASSAEKDTCRGLMENGNLSMENKQTIMDVVTGLKSAHELMKNAAWNK